MDRAQVSGTWGRAFESRPGRLFTLCPVRLTARTGPSRKAQTGVQFSYRALFYGGLTALVPRPSSTLTANCPASSTTTTVGSRRLSLASGPARWTRLASGITATIASNRLQSAGKTLRSGPVKPKTAGSAVANVPGGRSSPPTVALALSPGPPHAPTMRRADDRSWLGTHHTEPMRERKAGSGEDEYHPPRRGRPGYD